MAGPTGPSAPPGQGGGHTEALDSPTYSSDGPKLTGSSEEGAEAPGHLSRSESSDREQNEQPALPHAPRLTRLSIELLEQVRAIVN